MEAPDELDALIRDARRWEDPTLAERTSVRRAVALRISAGLTLAAATGGESSAARRGAGWARRAASRAGVTVGVLPGLVLVALCGLSSDASRSEPEWAEIGRLDVTLPPEPESSEPIEGPSAREPEPGEASSAATSRAATSSAVPVPAPAPKEDARSSRREPPASAALRRAQASDAPSVRPSLAAESRALAAVQRALRDHEPERALGLLDEQDQTFARGALVAERSAARVMALCDAQRADDAARAKLAFAARHPSSPLLARVRESCARSGPR